MRNLRILPALGAFFVLALVLAACGGGSVPGNAVAKVGDTSISKDTFNHWVRVAAVSMQGQGQPPGANVDLSKIQVPQPPDFTACVANKKKTSPKPAKGQPTPNDAAFKSQCKQEYEGLRDQVMQFLISAQWIQGEASDQGIKVSDSDVNAQFAKTKKQSFPKEADFKKFLASSGMTQQDILFRVKLDTISNKLRTKITKGKDKVTPAQIQAYYNKNKARFAQPERRDLRIVLTKDKAKAQQALSALKSGQSFASVVKKYSTDASSKAQGGLLPAVAKGQQEPQLDKAAFVAPKGKVQGPVKTQFGYYVFMVAKITAASQQSLVQATPTITQLLKSQNQQGSLDTFVKGFQKKWKAKTDCRKDYVTQDCKNAPKVKTNPNAVPPQQGGAAPPAQGGTPTPPPAQGQAPAPTPTPPPTPTTP